MDNIIPEKTEVMNILDFDEKMYHVIYVLSYKLRIF